MTKKTNNTLFIDFLFYDFLWVILSLKKFLIIIFYIYIYIMN